MVDLVPSPSSLGLSSPALGPWFTAPGSSPLPELSTPSADLSVSVSLNNDYQWNAPANGLLSYFVVTPERPPALARLRAENGELAFTNNRLVALFTLIPESELRLHALTDQIPSPDGSERVSGVPSRPRIRYLAMEFSISGIDQLGELHQGGFPLFVTNETEKAQFLGLTVNAGQLGNAETPVSILRRPKVDSILLENKTGSPVVMQLWCFDYRGRAIDPGAVAAWWDYLASVAFDNLWADSSSQRTAARADQKTVHFVSAHEGALPDTHKSRLQLTDLSAIPSSQALYSSGSNPQIALGTAPDPDNMPIPGIALLPHRPYADIASSGTSILSQWQDSSWPAELARDFVQIALIDVESHLTGLKRSDSAQQNARTRIEARQNTASPLLLDTIDDAADKILELLSNGANSQLMMPEMDKHWGSLDPGSFDTNELPGELEFTVHALAGEGSASGSTVAGQKVLIEFADSSLPANAWIRIWTHGLDTSTGRRFRQTGGGARTDASGKAFVVTALADGSVNSMLSFDAIVFTEQDSRVYTELRFDRPAPVPGSALDLPASPDIPAGYQLWISEQGALFARGTGQLGSGETLLAIPDDTSSTPYALVNPDTLQDDVSPNTLRNRVGADDTLIVTSPAFATTPEGDIQGTAALNGSTVIQRSRNGLDDITMAGRPVPTMERREVAAVNVDNAVAVVAAAPGREKNHEMPPSQTTHVGMPAAQEIHATGANLAGPAVVPLAVLMRERIATNTLEFVELAQQAVSEPGAATDTTGWSAVLETLTHGVAGDLALRTFAKSTAYQPGKAWLTIKNAIETATGQDLDAVIDSATFDDDALAKAVDNLLLKTREGSRQGATSLIAAVKRAEDFIYIETPAIDALSADAASIDLLAAIKTRLSERPALAVICCIPEKFLPQQPGKLEAIRSAAIGHAMQDLLQEHASQVVFFAPTAGSGRALYMASTTVIIDDVYALSGSTHLWRRGLTFDSSIAISSFDERVVDGRSEGIRAARKTFIADRLAVSDSLIPDDPLDLLTTVKRLVVAGGLGHVNPHAYQVKTDPHSSADQSLWNPDGSVNGVSDWLLFLGGLATSDSEEISNAIR